MRRAKSDGRIGPNSTACDPTPIQRRFLVWTLVSIPIAAFYVYAVLPAIDGFGELALVMFPLISLTGIFMTVPQHALRALVCGMVITVLVGLQPVYRADFVAFSDLVVASVFGTVTALVVTMLVRVIQGEVIARRILRAGWADLAQLASGAKSQSTQQFAARMLDRIGLLVPRLAQAKPSEDLHVADALRDLHIGVNLTELIEVGPALPAATQRALLDLRSRLGTYFLGMSQGAVVPPSPLLADIDAVVAILLRLGPSRLRERGVTAAVGLRQNLLSVASPVAIEAVSQ